jgi:chaperonin GroES
MSELKIIPYPHKSYSYPRIIVKPIDKEATTTESGLFIPTDVNHLCEIGIVFTAGEGSNIKKGDTVLYHKIERNEEHLDIIAYEDEIYDVVFENELLAVNGYPFKGIFAEPVSDMQVSETGLIIPGSVKGITQKGIIFRAAKDFKVEPGDPIEYRKSEQDIYPTIEIEGKRYDVLKEQDIFTINCMIAPYRMIVRIDKIAQQAKQGTSDSGLLRSELFLFMKFNLQYGEVLEIGTEARKAYPDMKIGDTAILHHSVEDKSQSYRVIKRDVSQYNVLRYEHRIINAWDTSDREILGRIVNRDKKIFIPYGKNVFLDWSFNVLINVKISDTLFTDFETNIEKCENLEDLVSTVARKKKGYVENAMAKVRGYRKLLAGIENPQQERETFQRYESLLKEAERDALAAKTFIDPNYLVVCTNICTNEKVITPYKLLTPMNVLGKKFLVAYDDYILAKLNSDMKITPIGNRLIVKPVEVTSNSALIVPDNAKEKPQIGIVMVVGTGKDNAPLEAKPGDKVFYRRGGGIPWPAEYSNGEDDWRLMVEGVDTFVVISEEAEANATI